MQQTNELYSQVQILRNKSIEQLEKLRVQIAERQQSLRELVAKLEKDAQIMMKYPSIEAARNGLLTFWGQREAAEKQLNDLKALTDKFAAGVNVVTPVAEMQGDNKAIMEGCFVIGEGYVNAGKAIKSYENVDAVIQGIIAEKKLSTHFQSTQLLKGLLEKPDIINNDAVQGKDTDFPSINRGFFNSK